MQHIKDISALQASKALELSNIVADFDLNLSELNSIYSRRGQEAHETFDTFVSKLVEERSEVLENLSRVWNRKDLSLSTFRQRTPILIDEIKRVISRLSFFSEFF